jgi:hypothetical protein
MAKNRNRQTGTNMSNQDTTDNTNPEVLDEQSATGDQATTDATQSQGDPTGQSEVHEPQSQTEMGDAGTGDAAAALSADQVIDNSGAQPQPVVEQPVIQQTQEVMQEQTQPEVGVVQASIAQSDQPVPTTYPGLSEQTTSYVNDVLASGTPLERVTLQRVLEYAAAMHPAIPVHNSEGCRHQVNLYENLVAFFNAGSDDFRRVFGTLLFVLSDLKEEGAFNLRSLFRFLPDVPMDSEKRKHFQYLLHTLVALSDPDERATVVKQIDLNKATLGLSDQGRQRFQSFFR